MAEMIELKEQEERVILVAVSTGEDDDTAASVDELEELAHTIKRASLCGLGQSAPNPVLSTMKYFRDACRAASPLAAVPVYGSEKLCVLPL